MFLDFNKENNSCTVAEPIDSFIFKLNDCRFTFTQLDNEKEIIENTVELLEQFEHQAVVSGREFNIINQLMNKIIFNHEMRLECEIRLRALKTKQASTTIPKEKKSFSVSEVLDIVNVSNNISEIEEALISLESDEYINIGKDGRELINVRISSIHSTFKNKEELLNAISEEVELIKTQLANLSSVENVDQLLGLMNVLNVQGIEDNSDIAKVVLKAIKDRKKPFSTIGQFKQLIKDVRSNIDVVSDTIIADDLSR